jgi:hypothetical protein
LGRLVPVLTADEQDLLAFERSWWEQRASKDAAIRARFGLDSSAYYRRLNGLLDRPEALAYDALLIKRLRRLRAARLQRRRSA